MTEGIKDMIAGCIERMRARSCGTCEHRDSCAFVWPEALGAAFSRPARRDSERPRRRRGVFALLMKEIAGAIRNEMQADKRTIRREVERHLEPLLASGAARIDRVAKAMGCSRQTLYRRLKGEGLTFEQVLDGLRHRHALKLMRDGKLAVKDAAYRLGFSDPAAFSRAFKRWTGQSPAMFRAAGRRDGAR